MNRSEPILPIRFYDDLFDQQRFSTECSEFCQLKLLYPSNELPHFQIRRPSKYELPNKFFLRNVCVDESYNYYKVIPEGSANFGGGPSDNFYGAFPKNGSFSDGGGEEQLPFLKIDCANLTSIPFNCSVGTMLYSEIQINIDDAANYSFKLIVDQLFKSVGSAFVINVSIGGPGAPTSLIGSITGPGAYVFDFYTGSGETRLILSFENMECDDNFSISYMQIMMNLFYDIATGDVLLDETKLRVIPMSDGTDTIVFCGSFSNNTVSVPKGQYYYIVVSGLDVYFSETFTIEDIKNLEHNYKLTWWNTCDLGRTNSVLYQNNGTNVFQPCAFRNILYLDSNLFRPEYDTTEEGDENGEGDISVQFQKWRKNLNFEVPKSPEFLTDALSAIFLHDNIYVKKPLNKKQDILSNEYKVLKVVNNISQVLDDCFQTVNLRFMLENKYIDTGCCTVGNIFDCTPCRYIAGDNCEEYGYILVIEGVGVHGLFDCSTGQLVSPPPRPTDLICYNGKLYTIELISNVWTVTNIYPQITNVTLVFIMFVVDADVVPFSFAQIEYNKDGGGWVYLDTIQGDANGHLTYWLPFFVPFGATDLKLRIHNVTLNCDYGYSDEYDVI